MFTVFVWDVSEEQPTITPVMIIYIVIIVFHSPRPMRYFRSGRPIMPYVYSTVHSFVATKYSKYLLAVVLEAPFVLPFLLL